jgi:outer membrane protein assembly factor BamB
VGCYTFPSLGDEDSLLAFDAATGAVQWKYRTVPGEQFPDGPPYHDYGFLNGPILLDGDDGVGGTRPLVVAGSKNGTLYALDRLGNPVWTNPLVPLPEFAGFGLFNGAPGFAGHRIFATLYDGGSANWPDASDHLYAFRDLDGAVEWSAQIGASWSGVALANGLVFAGTTATRELFVHDAATGARLNAFPLPVTSASGPSVVDGVVYVGYGIFSANAGVKAFALP